MAAQTLLLFRPSNADVLKETSNSDANKIVIVRKKPKTVSVAALVSEQISKGGKKIQRKEVQPVRGQPAPLAVARRNARERNRVRQVNNGFAALRQHIPEEVAEAFEGANAAKGANKKLSKVETLRMAVEYIRSLENLLNISEGKENCLSALDSFPSPSSSSSHQDQSYYSPENDDEDSNPPTHSYIRIPGTNTYQLYPSTSSLVYEDDENVQPLTPTSDMILQDDLLINPHILDSSIQFMNSTGQEFTVIPPMNSLIMPAMHNPMLLNEYSEIDEEEIDLKKEIPDIDGDEMDFDDNQHLGWWEQEENHEDRQS